MTPQLYALYICFFRVVNFVFYCVKIHMHGGVGKDVRRKLIGWFSKGSTYHLLSMGKKPFGRKFLRYNTFLFLLSVSFAISLSRYNTSIYVPFLSNIEQQMMFCLDWYVHNSPGV